MKILKFESPVCGPCKKMDKILETLGIQVTHINSQQSLELCRKYDISTLPTLVKVLDDGNIEKLIGLQPPNKVKEFCFNK